MATAAESTEKLEEQILQLLSSQDSLSSLDLSSKLKVGHSVVVGVFQSLCSAEMLTLQNQESNYYTLTEEGVACEQEGSSEYKVWILLQASSASRVSVKELDQKLGKEIAKIGLSKLAKKIKYVKGDGGEVFVEVNTAATAEGGTTTTTTFVDTAREQLHSILEFNGKTNSNDKALQENTFTKPVLEDLKKRKLITLTKVVNFIAKKGSKFALKRAKEATDLTKEMLQDNSWQQTPFKPYNFKAQGKLPTSGHLHPLLKLRQEYREIFLELGFQEMHTNQWVESSFWCFDTLFVPQQHPARDIQDTFFISQPASTPVDRIPAEYLKRVSQVHSTGAFGSRGYNYRFSETETARNVLRTHTTACSARNLYNLAQTGFVPGKYFSIDRVFRNEEMDKTHLCEFHQIEGFIVDRGVSLGNMMYVLEQFFLKIGVKKLRFKPAYNPYTEPSMEIFGYHEGLKRWIEVGNSGVFRPELLRPMGFDEDVSAIAWGLSLERPAMMMYEFNNIHKLVGHNVELQFVREAPITRITW